MDSRMNGPAIILGTMNFGKQLDERAAERMLRMFLDQGYHEIDTAHNYGEGATEEILGRILKQVRREDIYLATKANPFGGGGLSPERVVRQVETSLERLKTDYVDLLYLHAPDSKTPIEVTLEACQDLYTQGRFRELGLSNYAAWQVAEVWYICRQKGWVAPSVYQGMYNAITRDVERELFPAIKKFGIRFYAYNPLAGGMLAGKYADITQYPKEGRFVINRIYKERYWKNSYFEAVQIFREASERAGLSMTQVALLWIMRYSRLKGDDRDGVIIAASSLDQWEGNLKSLKGDLPGEVVEAIQRAWEKARPECPFYFRT